MRWLNRLATTLTLALTGMSLLLMLILAGAASLRRDDLPERVEAFGRLFAHGAGLAWPLFALLAIAMVALLAIAGGRAEVRSRRRGSALLLAAIALHAAWLVGIRPPTSRDGVFLGTFVYGHYGVRPEMLLICADSTGPLPRGPELVLGAEEYELPVTAATHLPDAGWAGSHPRDWPRTYSDSHGAQSWLVRLRGRLTGPGHYGWPPALHYRLEVDSVVSVSVDRPFQDECGVHDPPPER